MAKKPARKPRAKAAGAAKVEAKQGKGKAKGLEKQAAGEIATKSKAAEKSKGKGKGVMAKKIALTKKAISKKKPAPEDTNRLFKKEQEHTDGKKKKYGKTILKIVLTIVVIGLIATFAC